MACEAAIFQVLAQVSFGSLLSDIVITNDWLILIHFSVCLSVYPKMSKLVYEYFGTIFQLLFFSEWDLGPPTHFHSYLTWAHPHTSIVISPGPTHTLP